MFRVYDDDESGVISFQNLLRAARDLDEDVTKAEISMMVKMGDKEGIDGLREEHFLELMGEMGINNSYG